MRWMPNSIQSRLLVTASVVLLVFLGVTGWVLDQTFSRSVIKGAQQQLQLIVYALMGSASEKNRQLQFSDNLAEPRLAQPDSGLYAFVSDGQGEVLWRSRSAFLTGGASDGGASSVSSGFVFSELQQQSQPPRFSLSHAVTWEGLANERVHADHLTGGTDQGSPAVAWIDGSIRLDVRNPLTLADVGIGPIDGTDDAGSDGIVQSEGISDGDGPFPWA